MDRASRFYVRILASSLAVLLLSGCQSWITKDREKDNHFVKDSRRIKELMADPDRPRLIGEVASPMGMSSKHFDAFGIASSLPSTGGIVRPGMQRDMILAEMRTRDAERPEAFLDSPSTALVKLRTVTKPCNAKGDILDVEVAKSTECTATDLNEGYILEARLCEMAVLGGRMRTSEEKAMASGEVVILPTSYTGKPMTPLQGVIIGGARLIEEQGLGLRLESEFRHVMVTKAIEKAINTRYFFRGSNKQQMVAEGKNDYYLAISTVPKYKHDPTHFMSVIQTTGFAESLEEQQERLLGCRKLLSDRSSTRRAAAELEAIGTDDAKAALISGLASPHEEVRFYSAYSLAYLDCKESVPVLVDMARTTPAARSLCLVGLIVNEDASAREGLEQLLQESDPALRFGAFQAIRKRNASDFTVEGENIGNSFQFVHIPSATPLMAVSLQDKKEVILFGSSTTVSLAAPISPTPRLTLTPVLGDQIKMTKRQASGEVFRAVVASDIVSLLRGFTTIQASYNDVIHTIDQLASNRAMSSPVAMHPTFSDSQRLAEASKESNAYGSEEVVDADHTSVEQSDAPRPKWWTKGLWSRKSKSSVNRGQSADDAIPSDQELQSSGETTEDEIASMLNR